MTTTYRLDLVAVQPDGEQRKITHLATLATEDPAVMAATLRAAADRLDPPQPAQPAYRRGDYPRSAAALAPSMPRLSDACPNCVGDAHTYEPGRCALKPPWNGVVVRGDGKAPGTTL